MHKAVILLVKASDKKEAEIEVNQFMDPYGDGNVWDWFVIGGRWSNSLAPKELLEKFNLKAKEILPKSEHGFLSDEDVKKHAVELQVFWQKLGLLGRNPYSDHYNLPKNGGGYDIVPLSECIETVKEWVRDTTKETEEYFEKMVKERAKEKIEGHGTMSAYYAGLYRSALYNSFCFESNVYNITDGQGEKIPEDITGYWAVLVDMHN